MASPNGVGTRFGKPEITHLALLDEPGHCANDFLDWHQRVDPVLVVEVDNVCIQTFRALIASFWTYSGRPSTEQSGLTRPRFPNLVASTT